MRPLDTRRPGRLQGKRRYQGRVYEEDKIRELPRRTNDTDDSPLILVP